MKKDKKKKADKKPPENDANAATQTDFSDVDNKSELRQPCWSVVSFEKCAAKNLTYAEAERKIAELAKQGVSGLCLVTDAVAERIAKSF